MKCKLCGYPGCSAIISNGYYCAKHKAIADNNRKKPFENASRYGDYSSNEWRKLRARFLKAHPFCSRCGTNQVKLHVHHLIPVRDNPSRFLDESNLIVLCESCHAIETQREISAHRVP